MRKKDWWTPSEMFELLNEGLIEIKDFDMKWVEAEVIKQDLQYVESNDIETGNQIDGLIETDTIDLLPKLKPVYLHKTKSVCLNKLLKVCLIKLTPVCLNKTKSVCLNKLKPVCLLKLQPVCIVKLTPICLNKLTPVDIVKQMENRQKEGFDLKPVCLSKIVVDISKPELEVVDNNSVVTFELKPVCLSKIFVELQKLEPLNNGLSVVNTEEIDKIDENSSFEEVQDKSVSQIKNKTYTEQYENSTENSDTVEKSEWINSDESNSIGAEVPETNEVPELGDITQALNKGALYMGFDDEDVEESEEERRREEEILKQRAIKREEAKQRAEEEAILKEQKSKKFGKVLLISILAVVIVIAGAACALLIWNNEGSDVNGLVESTVEMAKPVPVELPIVTDSGEEEKIEFLHVGFTDLIKRNNNTVAWLKSEPLGLNYPIVQALDNDFYLTHDIDKKENAAGWLFMDCEVDLRSEPFNAVIYGHNRRDKVVFGNLKSLLDNNFATGKNEDFIYFTTMSTAYVYEICAVYVSDKSNLLPYTVNFDSRETKQEFVNNMIKSNQAPQFIRDDLSIDDKFLTLSTCHGASGTTKRLIVHCRLKYKAQNAGG